ncbi:hypothetical protein HG530_013823 [Fusarium avenaceum]|nr:hypothetical protein HG530_013823 [Fusarium avenaceum]
MSFLVVVRVRARHPLAQKGKILQPWQMVRPATPIVWHVDKLIQEHSALDTELLERGGAEYNYEFLDTFERLSKPAHFDISAPIKLHRGIPGSLMQCQRTHARRKIAPFEKSAEEERRSMPFMEVVANIEEAGSKNALIAVVIWNFPGYTIRRVAEIEVKEHWLRDSPKVATGAT